MTTSFDLIIIGAGPGGYVAAIRAAQLGLSTALVERGAVGGTCLNRGCIPTKTLLHTARLYREMQSCEVLGLSAAGITYDVEALYARKNAVVDQLRGGVEFLLERNGVTLLRGSAAIQSPGVVAVESGGETAVYQAKNILIATGGVPVRPRIPGIDLPGVLTSDDLLAERGELYRRLCIIGGGVIGIEFASFYAAMGCEVTVLEAADRILPGLEREISQTLGMHLKRRGVTVCSGATVTQIEQTETALLCHFTHKGSAQTAEADAVLVAVGRRADTDGLFAAGFDVNRAGGIVVDDCFQTGVPGIYAIGDVIHGGIQLAHMASAQGIHVVTRLAGKAPDMDLSVVPACVYTDPEIACVGLTADEAKTRGLAVKTGKFMMSSLGRSVIEGQERGYAKLVADAESGVLLGAQLICARASDLIGELATAIVNRLTVEQLGSVIRPHPSFTEGIGEAAEDVLGSAIHIAPKGL